MANGTTWGAALAVAAMAIAGCGEDGGTPPRPPAAAAATDADAAPAVDLDPEVTGRELMRLKRVGAQMGTSDLVKYGADGSVVVVMAYGGGGEKIMRCRLRDGELARLRGDLRRLPLDPPPPQPEPERPTFYTAPPAQYTLTAGRHVETFTQVEMPRDARPLVRRLEGTLSGRAARCRTTYRTRRS
jgi:hypothetical protein